MADPAYPDTSVNETAQAMFHRRAQLQRQEEIAMGGQAPTGMAPPGTAPPTVDPLAPQAPGFAQRVGLNMQSGNRYGRGPQPGQQMTPQQQQMLVQMLRARAAGQPQQPGQPPQGQPQPQQPPPQVPMFQQAGPVPGMQ